MDIRLGPYSNKMQKILSISIALCTYNGESFLWDQLNSFINQTTLPDEVVICDDGSRDGTLKILEEFAAQAPFPVRIYQNAENLGWSKNFEKAITLCTGDLIALSDQDDEWLPHKLAKIEGIFKERANIGYVLHNSSLVNTDSEPLGSSLWELAGYPEKAGVFKPGDFVYWLLKNKPVYGHTITFKAQLKKYLFPLPENCYIDSWIGIIGNYSMDVVLIHEPLAKYRQHSAQFCGVHKVSLWRKIQAIPEIRYLEIEGILERKKCWEAALSRLMLFEDNANLEVLKNAIKRKISHFEFRGNLPLSFSRRIVPIIKESLNGNYMRYSNSFWAILKDLVF